MKSYVISVIIEDGTMRFVQTGRTFLTNVDVANKMFIAPFVFELQGIFEDAADRFVEIDCRLYGRKEVSHRKLIDLLCPNFFNCSS